MKIHDVLYDFIRNNSVDFRSKLDVILSSMRGEVYLLDEESRCVIEAPVLVWTSPLLIRDGSIFFTDPYPHTISGDVILVRAVTTSGRMCCPFVNTLRPHCNVVAVVSLIDRGKTARPLIKALGVPFHSVLTRAI